MTVPPILESLSREFSTSPENVQRALEMLDAGLSVPFISRFRRGEIGAAGEHVLRRLQRRRTELEELDRRRGTILRLLEKHPDVTPKQVEAIQTCMDRFELEDLFVPHRRPEPEVQLAIDRGLLPLAELLVAPAPRAAPEVPLAAANAAATGILSGILASPPSDDSSDTGANAVDAGDADAVGQGALGDEPHADGSEAAHPDPSHSELAHAEDSSPDAPSPDAPSPDAPAPDPSADSEPEPEEEPAPAPTLDPHPTLEPHAHIDVKAAMNAQLARLCADFVNPDRGIHTDAEALHGALRILSDRLGRNARLRGAVRNLLRKQGVLVIRPAADESRLGRHKGLVKQRHLVRQLQGHRLLAIRQAQKERAVNATLTLDPAVALPKVRAALGRHLNPAWSDLLDEVALQALQYRLLPMVEQDVRLELKERADHEALRFLTQHLRQILMTPVLPRAGVLGVDVSAKGDWTAVPVGEGGVPLADATKIEVGERKDEELGAELGALLGAHGLRHVALPGSKPGRAAALRVRAALRAASQNAWVIEVNDAGLSAYGGSEWARSEFPEVPVPARLAISLARRLQDPLPELLKLDPRHLGLGWEQGLVSKANVRRALLDTIESCCALVGADLNAAPRSLLVHLPGLDKPAADRILARRAERPFDAREDLRQEGLLDEARWTSAAAFLRVRGGSEPLDATNLHPEQYPLAQRLLESAGSSVQQGLGHPGATRGMRRADFDVDEVTWRDLMRELAFPGRDPRWRQWGPTLLDPDTDPVRLAKDRVVEGIVTNVSSFGAFVDIGLANDALVHVSEIADRYVRDARELVSIGQVLRLRILDASGSRLTLSLKNVPPPERAGGGQRGGYGQHGGAAQHGGPQHAGGGQYAGAGQRGGGGPRGEREGGARPRGPRRERRDADPRDSASANQRAATSRRDGLGARSGRGGRGGAGGRGEGGGRGGRRGDERRPAHADVADREDMARLSALRPENKPAHTPFAAFFKNRRDEEPGTEG